MKEKYYLLDPNGEKIGPADILELTQWARDGKILPENTVCDENGNTCNARDIISFIKVTPKMGDQKNPLAYIIISVIMMIIAIMCVMAYMGLRTNYLLLQKDFNTLQGKYNTITETLSNMEQENQDLKSNASDFIKDMVKKYNMLESEKETLNDKLTSLSKQHDELIKLNQALETTENKSQNTAENEPHIPTDAGPTGTELPID